MKQIEKKIKAASTHNNASDNKEKCESIGNLMAASTDPVIKPIGIALQGTASTGNDAILNQDAMKAAYHAATKTVNEQNGVMCKAMNDAGKKVMEKFPNNDAQWTLYGFEVTSGEAHDQTVPDKVLNSSITQGDFAGQVDVHFDPSPRADNYTLLYTTGDPTIAANYKLVTNPKMIFTSSKISFNLPPDALNKDLWVIVTAHNTAGDSPASEPFGGRKIQ